MTAIGRDGSSIRQGQVWRSPRLTVLGDIGSLTETGSMMSMESPQDLCIDSINATGNTCMG